LLEHFDVDLGALATKRAQPALDGLLDAATGELLATQWAHRFPLRRPRRRPCPRPATAAASSPFSSASSSAGPSPLPFDFAPRAPLFSMSFRPSATISAVSRFIERSAGVGHSRRNFRYFGSCPQPDTKYCCTIWKIVVAIQ